MLYSWSLTPVTSCGWLAPPPNGHKEGISYLAGSTVHFHCDGGYNLFGAEASTCQADGTWSRPSPMCQPGEGARPTCLSPPDLARKRPHPSALFPARSHAVLLSIIFGGLAVVALVALVYVLLRRRKGNM